MADKSLIEWTDATWNPITGCTLVDDGCKHCYAAHLIASWPAIGNHPSRKGLARKNAAGEAKFTGEVRFNEAWLDQPLRWKKHRLIFVCAHGDLFHESVPDEWIDRVFAVMALCPQHTFQVLTKRPERMQAYITGKSLEMGAASRAANIACIAQDSFHKHLWGNPYFVGIGDKEEPTAVLAEWPLPNVWLGTSISDQHSANLRVPHLLATPAAVRFVSAEPLLGPVDLEPWLPWPTGGVDMPNGRPFGCFDCEIGDCQDCPKDRAHYVCDEGPKDAEGCPEWVNCERGTLDWIIVGGESGPHARPMHPDWPRQIRDQCQAAGVAFFFKQWGEWGPAERLLPKQPGDLTFWPDGTLGAGNANDNGGPGWSLRRLGKRRTGRLLDGREWNEMPAVRHG